MFELTDVVVKKNGRTVIDNINTTITERRVGIIGLNGSGKSTFAKLLNGLEEPTSGTIRYANSQDVKERRRNVGFVFQNPDNQIVYPIVGEDLEFGLKNLRLSPAEIKRRIDEVAQRFRMTHLLDRLTHQLSGGELQMVALAGVLVMQPKVVVFDEPTTLLDLKNKNQLLATMGQLEQQVIMISHDLEALRTFDRILHIERGAIKRDGPPDEVLSRYVEECA